MHILIITTEYPPAAGGIGSFAAAVARGLTALGDDVEVIATKTRATDTSHSAITKRSLWERKGFKLAPIVRRGALCCLRQRPDVTLAMTWTHEGVAALLLKCLFGTPYILVAHGSEILRHRNKRIACALLRLVFKNALLVCANSTYTMRLVERLKAASQVAVINPPVGLDQWLTMPEGDQEGANRAFQLSGKTVLLTAARLVPRKGHLLVIQALARLRDRFPDLVFVFTGDGEYRTVLEQEARNLGVLDAVRMPGKLPELALRGLFWRADIYVSPTLQVENDVEGFGIALVEAAACGKAAIAGHSGGTEDAVVHGESGLLLEIVDADSVTGAIALLLEKPELRARLGMQARRRAFQLFGIDKQVSALRLAVCRSLGQTSATGADANRISQSNCATADHDGPQQCRRHNNI